MDTSWNIGFAVLSSILFMTMIFFLVAKKRDRYDVVDIAWGLVFIAITGVALLGQAEISLWSVQSIVSLLVLLWGFRLAKHISIRWGSSKGEDRRYVAMRKTYAKKPGGVAFNMYFRVYIVQALLAVVIVLPVVLLASSRPIEPSWWTLAGVVVWIVGFYFEVAADSQLARHISLEKKNLLTTGVWRVSRHPNYFGEAAMWWGIWLFTVGTPFAWWALVSPVVITVLVRFISGVPLTEKHTSKKTGWKDYAAKTSIFLPLPPKKG